MLSSRDPIAVAKAARMLVQSGAWQTLPGRDDQARILTALKSQMPYALQQLPLDGAVALGKAPGPGRYHWCAALLVRGLDQPELPRNEINLALLGNGCADCRQRWAITDRATELVAAVQERERLTDELCRGRPWLAAALVASVHGPHSLHHQMDRDCWRMGAYRAGLKWGINPGIFTGDRLRSMRLRASRVGSGPHQAVRR